MPAASPIADPAGDPTELGGIAGWVTDVIDAIGEVGVGALIALENVFPPIPSEVILPFAGFSAAQGRISLTLAWVAATIGALAGAWLLYGLGAVIGRDRVRHLAGKRWFLLFGDQDLDRGEYFFARYGSWVVLGARCVPLLRSIVSVPAGIERMPLWRFSLLTALGSGAWNAIFIGLGYQLGARYRQIETYVAPVSYAVVILLVVALGWLSVRKIRRQRES